MPAKMAANEARREGGRGMRLDETQHTHIEITVQRQTDKQQQQQQQTTTYSRTAPITWYSPVRNKAKAVLRPKPDDVPVRTTNSVCFGW